MTQRHTVFNSWDNYYNAGLGQSFTKSWTTLRMTDLAPLALWHRPWASCDQSQFTHQPKTVKSRDIFLNERPLMGGNIVTMTNRLTLNRALNTSITCNNITCVYLPATAWNARFIAGYCSTAGHTTNQHINRSSARVTSWTTTQTVVSDSPIVSLTTSKYAPQT